MDTKKYADYVVEKITEICKNCGPRPAGSEADIKAQEYYVRHTKEVCDKTEKEEFKCSDTAFMSWVVVGAVLVLSAFAFFIFGMPVVSLALTMLALFVIIGEFGIYKQILDLFFKKKTSANIIGTRKASGETKRRIVFCGHTDSAFEWTYTYYGGRPAVLTIILSAVVDIVLLLAGSITAICLESAFNPGLVFGNAHTAVKVFAILLIIIAPVIIAAFAFCNFKKPVMGANDDLTGCYISLAIVKYLKDNDIRFENTEVVSMMAGGEECGLRGSKAYAKLHKDELKNPDVETVFIGLDTVREFDFMQIIDKDLNGLSKSDLRVVNLIKEGAHLAGFDNVSVNPISLGATDAAAMNEIGVPAASFTAMDPAPARYYHTRLDAEDNLDKKAIDTALKIMLETLFLFDKKGLK